MKIITTFSIDSDLMEKLKKVAKQEERSVSFLISKSVETYLKSKSHETETKL